PDAIVEGVTLAALSANAAPAMAGEALYADLTVVGPVRSGVEKALVCGALLETPSAVLVWPGGAAAPPTLGAPGERAERLGRRVAIAWDGRREAARAVRQAAPFLRAAEHVEIVCVSHFMGLEPFDAPAGERLRAHLAAQGVRAALAPRDGGPVGEVLLETAREGLADLIVMGGYGHSRLRESLFGGVTERLIGVSDIPLLLAH
ncbi:MAG: universal stress protein, partial [Pseudomonadota bacterium]